MKPRGMPKLASAAALSALLLVAAGRQAGSGPVPNAASVVKPTAYVSLDKVPRGQMFEAAVVVEITPGFHMNSHKPSEDYLIPTTITPNPPPGVKVVDTIYPPGKQKSFAFSPNKPLDVYSDRVTLTIKMSTDSSLAVGKIEIPTTLRYQACNDTMCLPPVRLPVAIESEIAPAGAAAHPVHSDVFQAAGKN